MVASRLPRVRSSLVLRRNVGGFEHKGTVALAVGGIVVVGVVAVTWNGLRRAGGPGGPSPLSTLAMLNAAALQLEYEGFAGCATVQQLLDLTREPGRSSLLAEATGIDPWGTPYQLECANDQVHAFSMAPDKRGGIADDIRREP
jgi:hypothetical protein